MLTQDLELAALPSSRPGWSPFHWGLGPIIDVGLGCSASDADFYRSTGQVVPAPFSVPALIDTGSSGTFIAADVAHRLQARPTGERIKTYGSMQECQHLETYVLDLAVPFTVGGAIALRSHRVSVGAFSFGEGPRQYAIILGTDVLRHLVLCVDGPAGLYQLFQSAPTDPPKGDGQ